MKLKKNGKVKTDHSSYFEKWQELVNYVALNNEWIYNECGFVKEEYGEAALFLLALRYEDVFKN